MMMSSIASNQNHFIKLVRSIYGNDFVPLHRPIFCGNEKTYLSGCIDSNFVSTVGEMVSEFEKHISNYCGTSYAIATVNGTSALHVALQLVGASSGTEVITQPLTFVATCNAISYTKSEPVFIDVDRDTMGMSPEKLRYFLEKNTQKLEGAILNKKTGKRIVACMPMHTFGLPCRIEEIAKICAEWGINLVEDSAESLGSFTSRGHTGTIGQLGVFSFNGNKIITTGGGGVIITDDADLAARAKHITTTAKVPHKYEFVHDEIGYNYRLPSLNAALGCAQMEQLSSMLKIKKEITETYKTFFNKVGVQMAAPLPDCTSNNWLNAIILSDKAERNEFLDYTNSEGVMTRPIWRLMPELDMFKHCYHDGLEHARWLEERVVNIPSSVPDATTVLTDG